MKKKFLSILCAVMMLGSTSLLANENYNDCAPYTYDRCCNPCAPECGTCCGTNLWVIGGGAVVVGGIAAIIIATSSGSSHS